MVNATNIKPTSQLEGIEATPAKEALPYNLSAEQALIGCMIVNNNIISDVIDLLKGEHFYDSKHQKIYNSIVLLFDKRINVHHITINQHLQTDSLFEGFDLARYLQGLIAIGMSVLDPMSYAGIVHDLALRRELIYLSAQMNQNAINKGLDYNAIMQIEDCENVLYNLATEGTGTKSFQSLSEGLKESIALVNKNRNLKTRVTGIPSQFKDLDDVTSGFHKGDLFILAARPGMGKTTLALNFMYRTAAYLAAYDQSVGIFSLEMPINQLSNKLIALESGVNSEKIISGKLDEYEYNQIRTAADRLAELPIYIDDTGALSISSIRARARRLKRKYNLGILFIDYLQLIQASRGAQNRVVEISEITQSLKALAKELGIPIIALSQLSRAVEQRQDKRPLLSDLRESGSIEQDADIVMFIYRDEYYNRDSESNKGLAELLISKHRNGRTGVINVRFRPEVSGFVGLDEEVQPVS